MIKIIDRMKRKARVMEKERKACSSASTGACISTNKVQKNWCYWRYDPIGVSFPYPQGWVVDKQSTKVIIRESSPETVDGTLLTVGMTFIYGDFSGSPLASLGDQGVGRQFVDDILSQGNKRSLSREDIRTKSGHPAILFSHSYRKGDTDMKAVCLVAVVDLVFYYIDVTGVTSRIDVTWNPTD